MRALVRIAHPGAGGVFAVLIKVSAVDDENLGSALVAMSREGRLRRPAHELYLLAAETMQRQVVDAGLAAGQPCRRALYGTRCSSRSIIPLPVPSAYRSGCYSFNQNSTVVTSH